MTNTLTKTSGGSGWNASAVSVATMPADGEISFRLKAGAQGIVIGLNETTDSSGSGYVEITYGLHATVNTVEVVEAGIPKTAVQSYLETDVFKIIRQNDIIYYAKNNAVFYQSRTTSSAELLADVSIYAVNDAVYDATLTAGSTSLSGIMNVSGPTMAISLTGRIDGNIMAIPAPGMSIEMIGAVGQLGNLGITGPTMSIAMQGEWIATGRINIGPPSMGFSYGIMSFSGPVMSIDMREEPTADNAIAYCMNVHTTETTKYTNYPFLHVLALNGKYYGLMNGGLYLLEGETDNGTPITTSATTAETDFDSNVLKRVQYAYMDCNETTTIQPIVEGEAKNIHKAQFGGRRTQLALGNQGRFWRFKISNFDKLTGIEIVPIGLQRKMGGKPGGKK